MNIKFCILFAVVALCFMLPAAQLPAGIKVDPTGTVVFDGGKLFVCVYNSRWRSVSNTDFKNIQNNISAEGGILTASFDRNDIKGKFILTLIPVDVNAFDVNAKFEFDKPHHLPQIAASLEFPVKDLKIDLDGKTVVFKKKVTPKDKAAVVWSKFKTCEEIGRAHV